jgi:hypothetical protein
MVVTWSSRHLSRQRAAVTHQARIPERLRTILWSIRPVVRRPGLPSLPPPNRNVLGERTLKRHGSNSPLHLGNIAWGMPLATLNKWTAFRAPDGWCLRPQFELTANPL